MPVLSRPHHQVSGYQSWRTSDARLIASWTCENIATQSRIHTILPHAEPSLVARHRDSGLEILLFGPSRTLRQYRPNRDERLFGVTIAPEVLPLIFGIHADELVDSGAPLTGPVARRLNDRLEPWLNFPVTSVQEIWRQIVLAEIERPKPRRLEEHQLAAALRRSNGALVLQEAALALDMSERQLRRRFIHAVGISPKQYARELRLTRVMSLADNRPRPDWADLAFATGYCDQAHLNRDCRAIAGLSPTRLHAERNGMSEISKTLPAPV